MIEEAELVDTEIDIEIKKGVCPECGIAQADHWKCACPTCQVRGHSIPRSTEHPQFCSWCVEEGCAFGAQPHELVNLVTVPIGFKMFGKPPGPGTVPYVPKRPHKATGGKRTGRKRVA